MNIELKLNVDEQQDDIKHLEEYCDIDDIEPIRKEIYVCVTCDHIAKKNWLQKHIQEKHWY